jgi:hypothetical protein
MPVVLKDKYRRAYPAEKQADCHRPENQECFLSLLPGSLMPENKFSQQVKRRMLWFDVWSIGTNGVMSMLEFSMPQNFSSKPSRPRLAAYENCKTENDNYAVSKQTWP